MDKTNKRNLLSLIEKEKRKIQINTARLFEAVKCGHIYSALSSLNNGAEVNKRGVCKRTPLHWAAQNNYFTLSRILIDRGADIETKDGLGYTPLHYAVMTNKINLFTFLLKNGAKISTLSQDKWLKEKAQQLKDNHGK